MSDPAEIIQVVRRWVEKAEAVVSRYPGDQEPISLEEAQWAVETARRTRQALRQHLPQESLR